MKTHKKSTPLFFIFLSAIFLCVAAGQVLAQEIDFKTVVLNGDSAQGADLGSTFFAFNDVAINDTAEVSFRAFLETIVFEGCDLGLWVGSPSSLSLVACDGYPAPETEEGVTFLGPGGGFPGNSILNELGQIAFTAGLQGDSLSIYNDEGIWVGNPDNLRLVAREGKQAAGTPEGVNFIGLASAVIALNNIGQVAFHSHLTGHDIDSTNDIGIWLGSLAENLSLIARKGYEAPNTSEGVTFSSFNFANRVNDSGEVVFLGRLDGPGVTGENDEGLWLGGPNNLRLVVRTGDVAPELPVAIRFRPSFMQPTLNNRGEIAFTARVTGSSDVGLWSGFPDSLSLIAKTGDPAPGTEPGVVFTNFFSFVLNGNGKVAFKARVSGPGVDSFSCDGIWTGSSDGLEIVVRGGYSPPGTAPNRRIYNIPQSNVYLNEDGDVAFDASVSGFSEPANGVWFKPHNGEISTVVMTGDEMEVLPGDFRLVSAADISSWAQGSGNQDGRRSSLSDSNHLAFRVSFYDGSRGIFLANTTGIIQVSVDIKPGSCPNPLNVRSKGVLPLAILGSDEFDVTQVDPTSITLEGVSPLRWAIEDVATPHPINVDECNIMDCNEETGDGVDDLTLKFDTQEIYAAIPEVSDRECLILDLTGNLKTAYGDLPFKGGDVVSILKKGKKHNVAPGNSLLLK